MNRLKFVIAYAVAAVALLVAAAAVLVAGLSGRDEEPLPRVATPFVSTPWQVERGAYLARAGNCIGCHTAVGGPPFAGGNVVVTPFGGVEAPNLTPDDATGLGRWTEPEFWRALHNGRSRDGHLLAPAFPYPNYTQVSREDVDSIYAYLRSLPPVSRGAEPSGLRFPYGTQAALAAWRALYFRPGIFEPDHRHDATWNRGAYLVRGLGHCEACHTSRNALGGIRDAGEFGGGMMPTQRWYAPALAAEAASGAASASAGPVPGPGASRMLDVASVVTLLKTGVSPHGAAIGPMADIVATSTRHLDDADLLAIAVFVRSLPPPEHPDHAVGPVARAPALQMDAGRKIYHDHCAACHGDAGEGASGAYPPLANNRSVRLASPVNVVQAIVEGGYPPSTPGNPRPYGMPPFVGTLDEQQIADVATYVRQSFGNLAPAVSLLEVKRAH
jgi:mono/diheme cytochrome c family protein